MEKLLVVADADGQNPATVVQRLKRRLVENYPFPVVPLIIVQALESWLIADPLALETFWASKCVSGIFQNLKA